MFWVVHCGCVIIYGVIHCNGVKAKQRNKETKKQRNKETKKQRNKETKKQRNKETKKQRNKENNLLWCFCCVGACPIVAMTYGSLVPPRSHAINWGVEEREDW
jgi:uncharacterized ion transporter superfamily protein YfcC